MIDLLTLVRFRRHEHVDLRLSPLTVLVGPNGSGKTSVLTALQLIGQMFSRSFNNVFSSTHAPDALERHSAGERGFRVRVRGHSSGIERTLSFWVKPSTQSVPEEIDTPHVTDWLVEVDLFREGTEPKSVLDLGGRTLRQFGGQDFWPEFASAAFLRLDAQNLSAVSPASARARVEDDGSSLATVLANMKLTEEERFKNIQQALRDVVPHFRAMRLVPTTIHLTPSHRVTGYSLRFDMDSGTNIDASQISEGTLYTLALLTVLHSPSRPRLLLLDDVHEALHPKAQARLMSFLKEITTGPDAVQIIATTHSPYIVDCVEPEAVLAFAPRPDGTSAVRPLSEHPEADRFRGRLSSGQLWTLDDEQDWVLEAGE